MVCVTLTARHRKARRSWPTDHVNWRRNEWRNILFSDESRFYVHLDIITFSPGENVTFSSWNNPSSSRKISDLTIGEWWSKLVFQLRRHTNLHVIRTGALTGSLYRDDILRPIVAPYVAAIADKFMLLDDKCSPRRVILFEEGIVQI